MMAWGGRRLGSLSTTCLNCLAVWKPGGGTAIGQSWGTGLGCAHLGAEVGEGASCRIEQRSGEQKPSNLGAVEGRGI